MRWTNKPTIIAAAALTLVLGAPTIAQAGPDIDVDLIFSNGFSGRWMSPNRLYQPLFVRHPGKALGHYKHPRRYISPRHYSQWRNGRSIQLRLGDISIIHRDYDQHYRKYREHLDRDRYRRHRRW